MMGNTISRARLFEVLDYSPGTGIFTWKIQRVSRAYPGDVAGTVGRKGYVAIKVDGRTYQAHRLAWFYVTGDWPKSLDHRDNVKANNAFINLREATNLQNSYNKGRNKRNTSGFKGVYWESESGKWRSAIRANGKRRTLGRFITAEAAHYAYAAAAAELHGEFARIA